MLAVVHSVDGYEIVRGFYPKILDPEATRRKAHANLDRYPSLKAAVDDNLVFSALKLGEREVDVIKFGELSRKLSHKAPNQALCFDGTFIPDYRGFSFYSLSSEGRWEILTINSLAVEPPEGHRLVLTAEMKAENELVDYRKLNTEERLTYVDIQLQRAERHARILPIIEPSTDSATWLVTEQKRILDRYGDHAHDTSRP